MDTLDPGGLQKLLDVLSKRGYSLIGPTVRDGTIVYDAITTIKDLPRGWTDVQEPGMYKIKKRTDEAFFAFTVSPFSWKRFLFPPRQQLFTATKAGKSFQIETKNGPGLDTPARYALVGVRSCELQAIAIQDKVFAQGEYSDPIYRSLRERAFIVAVNCVQAGGTCFCVSMGTGPRANCAYDLVLTEILLHDGSHYFIVESGSAAGNDVLEDIPHISAQDIDRRRLDEGIEHAKGQMGRTLDTTDIKQVLMNNFEHQEWDSVAKRCLACANCTLVCPTCFCSTVEDTTDLTGYHAERWRRWDSCFTMDFAKVAGGNIRPSTRARYRQWMMHKLSYWFDQFGTAGCVGCGRCITWCPVGIDITAEAQAIREGSLTTASTDAT